MPVSPSKGSLVHTSFGAFSFGVCVIPAVKLYSVVGPFSGSFQFIFLQAIYIYFFCSLSEYLCPRWPGFFITWKIPQTPDQKAPQVNHISIYFPHISTEKTLGNKAKMSRWADSFPHWLTLMLVMQGRLSVRLGCWVPEGCLVLSWFFPTVLNFLCPGFGWVKLQVSGAFQWVWKEGFRGCGHTGRQSCRGSLCPCPRGSVNRKVAEEENLEAQAWRRVIALDVFILILEHIVR